MTDGSTNDRGEDTRERPARILAWRQDGVGRPLAPAPEAPAIPVDAQRHIRQLRAALRRERLRGRAGHWTYDLARHLSLARQLRRIDGAAD